MKPRRTGPTLIGRAAALPFIGVILLYRVTLSPIVGGQCRFEPTCSKYGLEAYRRHGPIRGTWLTVLRILRCQPFAANGYDPVPLWGQPRTATVRPKYPPKPREEPAPTAPARYLAADDARPGQPPAPGGAPEAGPAEQEHA